MKKFKYTAITSEGVKQDGELAALSTEQAVSLLRDRSLLVTNIAEERSLNLETLFSNWRGVPRVDLIVFTRQLAVMLDAGIPIVKAMRALQDQTRVPLLADILKEVIEDVDGGASLHKAMSRHPETYEELYLSLISAGERSGNLVAVLNRLAETLRRDHDFKSKTRGALIYPAVIVIVMIGVVLIMFLFVIPRLQELYDELGATLPLTTRILLGTSDFLTTFWWLILLALVAAGYLLRRYAQKEAGKINISKWQLKLPIFGMLTKQVQLTSFTRTLSMLISSGLPILEALEISKQTMSNQVFRSGVDEAMKAVERGGKLGEELTHNPTFPSILSEMVKVGEQTGRLDDILGDLSEYFESESLRTVDNLSSLLEPIIMIILGVGIGFLVISLILPIYTLTSSF